MKDGPGNSLHAPEPDASHREALSADRFDEAAFAKADRLPAADSRVMGNRTLALALCTGSFVLFGMSNALPVLDHGLEGRNLRFLGMVGQYWHMAHYGVASVIALATTVLPVCQLILLLLAMQPTSTSTTTSNLARPGALGGFYRSLCEAVARRPILPFAKCALLANVTLIVGWVVYLSARGHDDMRPDVGLPFFFLGLMLSMLAVMTLENQAPWDGGDFDAT
ncbi:paraquat-inducible protein A [Comamonadaceae bacterium PP-2]